jgi:predicted GNAT family N-acyltransferase
MVVRTARDRSEVTAALDLRERVFCGEQGVAAAAERDGRDGEALHVVALDERGEVVGTCRVLIDGEVGRLGRMAVERAARGRGVGAAVLREAEARARDAGARRMRLHAQLPAEPLYAREGYVPYGERFIEEGIDHVAMEKELA